MTNRSSLAPAAGILLAITVAAVVMLTAGCGRVEEHAAEAHDAAAEAVHGAGEPAAEMTPAAKGAAIAATLKAADALDGETDHVVARCPGCSLAMDGKAEHARAVGDYELHFCSASCADHFIEDAEASLIALKVPDTP